MGKPLDYRRPIGDKIRNTVFIKMLRPKTDSDGKPHRRGKNYWFRKIKFKEIAKPEWNDFKTM